MKIYSNNNDPLTEEEVEEIKKSPQYREIIKNDLTILNSSIDKLVIDRNRSDKIIGLVIGTEISCFLTALTDIVGITTPSDEYSAITMLILFASIVIRNYNLIKNINRNTKIRILNNIKEEIISENDWLNNNQKTLKY